MRLTEWLESWGIPWKESYPYEIAVTHTSYLNEHKQTGHVDNERLEFLGDSVLQMWVTERLFALKPVLNEGQMTNRRQQLVCEKALAGYSRKTGLPQHLKLGAGEEKTGGRERNSVISDAFEALLGAIYLDAGREAVDAFLTRVIAPDITHPEATGVVDYKSRLQEYIQSDRKDNVVYRVAEMTGPSNDPHFVIDVLLEDIVLGTGEGSSKKRAEQDAARDALSKLAK